MWPWTPTPRPSAGCAGQRAHERGRAQRQPGEWGRGPGHGCGASGYVHQSRGIDALVCALERVLNGEIVIDVPDAPPRRPAEPNHALRLAAHLTGRERQCLLMLVEGLDTAAMVERLGVSRTTVRTHLQAVLTKLGVHSRLEAASFAVRHRLPDLWSEERPAAAGEQGAPDPAGPDHGRQHARRAPDPDRRSPAPHGGRTARSLAPPDAAPRSLVPLRSRLGRIAPAAHPAPVQVGPDRARRLPLPGAGRVQSPHRPGRVLRDRCRPHGRLEP